MFSSLNFAVGEKKKPRVFGKRNAWDLSIVLPESQRARAEVGLIYDTLPPRLSARGGDKRADPLTFECGTL